MLNKYATAIFFILLSATCCYAQNAEVLQWKFQPNEVITYKTVMKAQIDSGTKIQLPALFKNLKDGDKNAFDFQKQMQELQKMEPDYFITTLKRNKRNVIDIEMTIPDNKGTKDTSQMGNLYQMMSKLSGGVMLRGAVYDNGDIQSFYLKNDQKNLIALFFQLPAKAVKVGDSWEINTNLISMDQNFKCDSAYKRNIVSLTAIDNVDGEKIATIKYDIEEYVTGEFGFGGLFGDKNEGKMAMRMLHKATARFSVTKGRWISYEGELETHNSGGFMAGDSKKKFSLIAE